ncbi:MAG: hypothetical protein IPG32_17610 [Saprospirales bacterium]|nr:hypothetical protein [Saprospirales bacterium]
MLFFNYPGGEIDTIAPVSSFNELAELMDSMFAQANGFSDFEWNHTEKTICATELSSTGFQELILSYCDTLSMFDSLLCVRDTLVPTIVPGCLVTEPEIDLDDILNPDSADIADLTIFDGELGTITTHSIIEGLSSLDPDTIGPSANSMG